MIPLNLNSLLQHLHTKNFDAKHQPETQQIYLVFDAHQQQFPLFIRVVEDSGLLQLLVFMAFTLQPSAAADTARFLHLLNKELDIPGFGMDESSQVVFYRVMLPTVNKKVDADIFEAYITSMKNICETFFPVIAAVGQGAATYEDVLKKMKELS